MLRVKNKQELLCPDVLSRAVDAEISISYFMVLPECSCQWIAPRDKGGPRETFTLSRLESWFWLVEFKEQREASLAHQAYWSGLGRRQRPPMFGLRYLFPDP